MTIVPIADAIRNSALAWAARGFRLIPLKSNGKQPIWENWPDRASADPAVISTWWDDGRPRNYGVVADDYLVIDIDAKNGKAGLESWAAMGGRFDTLCVSTPTGGFHLYYDCPGDWSNSAGKLGDGLDTRGRAASFVVGPGSVIDGAAYAVHQDAPLLPAPAFVLGRLNAPRTRAESGVAPLVDLDLPVALDHARAYLLAAPTAVEGDAGDQATYDVACGVRDYGISADTALELMLDNWNDRCAPPWDVEALEAKIRNAYAYGQNPPGRKLLEVEPTLWFDKVETPPSDAPEPAGINWLRPNDWEGREPPVLEWLAKDWIPADGIVTLLYGDGGTGKTRLAQELAACMAAGGTAAGYSWLGQTTAAGRVMCFFCEDSEDELWRRQLAINRRMGLAMADIDANFRLTSRVSEENLLMTWDRASGTAKLLPTWHQLRADAIAFKPDLIITDTIADTFGGSEIERAQVNAFVKGCLGRLGRETGCKAMLALGHPSVAGMASGTGTSGSTGWSNAVRSRLYLSRVDGAANKDIRELTGKKLNVGADGAMLKLKWRNDGFDVVAGNVPGDGASSFDQIADMNERCAVAALRECADRSLSPSPNAANYAPKILKRIAAKTLEALKVEEIEAALLRLQSRGAIVYEVVGRSEDSKPVRGIRLVEDKLSENTADIFA